ncbi:MAG TPA: hypothetical protein VGD65_00660 [Chryseosolibacter sp.]
MTLLKRIIRSNFVVKLLHWEYWPFGILQFPIFFYFGWLCLRSRSLLFFTASNPGIEMGGMFGESKWEILKKIPPLYLPKTIIIERTLSVEAVVDLLANEGFSYPLIFKPDLGERGFMVKRINNPKDISDYLKKIRIRFLAQELVIQPLEFGVFYHRHPSHEKGKVTSIVMKEMLSVTGDGTSTLQELISAKPRAKLQTRKLKEMYAERWNEIIPRNESIELVSIGNHALGTKFLNGNHLITEQLTESFDRISKKIEGFYFGRFDLRCSSLEALQQGNVKIVELNGCGAEPAHIYDPDFKIVDALKVLFRHWRTIFEISRENHKRGVQYVSFAEGRQYYRKFKDATRPG